MKNKWDPSICLLHRGKEISCTCFFMEKMKHRRTKWLAQITHQAGGRLGSTHDCLILSFGPSTSETNTFQQAFNTFNTFKTTSSQIIFCSSSRTSICLLWLPQFQSHHSQVLLLQGHYSPLPSVYTPTLLQILRSAEIFKLLLITLTLTHIRWSLYLLSWQIFTCGEGKSSWKHIEKVIPSNNSGGFFAGNNLYSQLVIIIQSKN